MLKMWTIFVSCQHNQNHQRVSHQIKKFQLKIVSTASTGTTQCGELWKVPKTPRADTQNKYTEISGIEQTNEYRA